ncbi:glycosyltransferase [Allomuricauda sp. SCSIO 65647]|uniref:glycosyltransferase n=1 Tax=Allomuricauda sp. SCSIO 65647 TaxID=2908843 RepID=UPI001F1E9AAD|nr:glycosyltransferase [Muricauda sp. SCSIO 65647]UJH67024.1 glycosyltransferase [Muricauda sp. SCSIO 65647]
MTKRTLLQINSVVNTGSTGRIAEDIGKVAINHGWHSHIAHGRHGNRSESITIKIGNKLNNYFHVINTRIFDNHGFSADLATKSFIRKIEELQPDIIHLHNLHGYYLNVKALFEYLATKPIPIVWTLHDCWSFTGHCAYFDLVNCQKWKTECSDCPQKNNYPASFVFDRSKENYYLKKKLFNSLENLTLTPVSYWLKSLLADSFLSDLPTKVMHNGIDLKKFTVKPSGNFKNKYKPNNEFVILGVANPWSPRKGYADMLKLSKKVGEDEKIIMVGLDKDKAKGLPKNIIGIEKTESLDDLAKLYSLADVFINPTYQDNFPTTNIEALACGTPIITYDTGGSPEAIDEHTGFVVSKGDINSLALQIRKIKELGKEHFTDACRKRAESLYDKEKKYLEYFNLYNQLLIS